MNRRGDDSKRTTRRGSLDEARGFDETTLSHKSVLFVRDLPVSTECAAALLFFRYPSIFSILVSIRMANFRQKVRKPLDSCMQVFSEW